MKMKKISKSRWAMLAFVVACLIVLFNVAGCAMLENKMNTMKGLVGMDDTIVVETPVCEGETCEDIRG
jgi:hypothetical protein